jgi:hypothetical protein
MAEAENQTIQLLIEIREDIRRLNRKIDAPCRKVDRSLANPESKLNLRGFFRNQSDKIANQT